MGGGSWSDADYSRSTRGRAAFAYSDDVLAKPTNEQKCHQLLDPYGLKVRESRDSAEHPESNAIMIGLDVTGSMAGVVVDVQKSLGKVMDMLLMGKYIPDPQLLFYAVGDATCDQIPFQVSQFESDNRINDQLTKMVLEGGGGGQMTESYELGFYCAARHTSIDCFEKRGRKGYLFTIGDEYPYPEVRKTQVKKIFNANLQDNMPLEKAVAEAKKKYHAFHIIPKGSSHWSDPAVRQAWADTLGGEQFVLMLKDPKATAETIAVAVGINEGALTLDEGAALVARNSSQRLAEAVRSALAGFAKYAESLPKKSKPKKNGGATEKAEKNKKNKKNAKDDLLL